MAHFQRSALYVVALCGWLSATLANPVTFDIGDIAQYTGSLSSTPTLTGSVVVFTPAADSGFDLLISPDLQTTLKKTMDDNCKEFNSACYQAVQNLLSSTNTELQPRQVDPVDAIVMAIVGVILLPVFYEDKQTIVVPIHLAPSQMSQASSLATATEIIVMTSNSQLLASITPAPLPTTTVASGTDAPRITTLTATVSGFSPGNVDVQLPGDLALRLQDFLKQTDNTACADGASFTLTSSSRLRPRAVDQDTYRRVICDAENLLLNAGSTGPFNQLQVAAAQPVQLVWQDPNFQRAQAIVQQYARNNAPTLRLTPDQQAIAVAGVAFGIAYAFVDAVLTGAELVVDNILSQVSLTNTQTTPTQSSCIATAMPTCGVGDCTLQDSNTATTDDFICSSGQSQGCECYPDVPEYSYYADTAQLALLAFQAQLLKSPVPNPPSLEAQSQCSRVNVNVENTLYNGMAELFCAANYRLNSDVTATYSASDIFTEASSTWNAFQFTWKKTGSENCTNTCSQIFKDGFSSTPCKFDQHTVAQDGKMILPCGEASYKIATPEDITQLTCGRSGWANTAFPRAQAVDAIDKFCNYKSGDWPIPMYTIDPDNVKAPGQMEEGFGYNSAGQFCFSNSLPGYPCGYWGCQSDTGGATYSVFLSGQFSVNQTGCNPKRKFTVAKGEVCSTIFMTIMDNCDTNTVTEKNGGVATQNTAYGCVDWQVGGTSA